MVETLVSFARGSALSEWPVYRLFCAVFSPHFFPQWWSLACSTDADATLQWGINGQLAGTTTGYHCRTSAPLFLAPFCPITPHPFHPVVIFGTSMVTSSSSRVLSSFTLHACCYMCRKRMKQPPLNQQVIFSASCNFYA